MRRLGNPRQQHLRQQDLRQHRKPIAVTPQTPPTVEKFSSNMPDMSENRRHRLTLRVLRQDSETTIRGSMLWSLETCLSLLFPFIYSSFPFLLFLSQLINSQLSNRLPTSNSQKSPIAPYPTAPRNRTLPALPDRTKLRQLSTLPVAGTELPSDKGDRGATWTSDLIAEYCYHAMKSHEFRLALAARDVDVTKLDVDELLERKGEKEVTMEMVHVMLCDRGRESKLTRENGTSRESQDGTTTDSKGSSTHNSIAAQLAARATYQATLNSKRKRTPERAPNHHGPVISVTNPRFLPGTNELNPFFEQMPRPEVWHRQAPRAGFLGFGDTPFSQQMMSDQIDADLARGPGHRLGGGRDQDRKVERRSGRAGMWDVPDVSDCEVFDIMKSLGGRIEEADSDSDGSEDEPMQSKKRKVEE